MKRALLIPAFLILVPATLSLAELWPPEPAVPEAEFMQVAELSPPLFRLVASIDQATVRIEGAKPRPFKGTPWALSAKGLPTWLWAGPAPAEIPLPDNSPFRSIAPTSGGKAETLCIWAHPHDSSPLTLTWKKVPPGKLHGYIHFLPSADDKSSMKLVVTWNNNKIKTIAPRTQKGKISEFSVDLIGHAEGKLTIAVETVKRGKNHICIDGFVAPPEEDDDEDEER